MTVRLYAVLGDAVLAAVRTQCAEAVAAWCRDWGLDEDAVVTNCHRAWEHKASPAWRGSLQSGAETAWLGWDNALRDSLQDLLFGPDRHRARADASTVAGTAAGAALDALAAALGRTLLGGQSRFTAGATDVPDTLALAGSGAVAVHVGLGQHTLHCVVDADTVRRIAAIKPVPATPLAPVDHAALLAGQPVRLAVAAGHASVGLGNLLSLAPGDVIRLDTLADQPLTVAGPDGTPLLRGYLGTSKQHLALDIVAGETTSGVSA